MTMALLSTCNAMAWTTGKDFDCRTLNRALIFRTKEEAERDRCEENEVVVELNDILSGR